MKYLFLTLFALALILPTVSSAQEVPRIAVIDLTELFEKHPDTPAALQKLTAVREASGKRYHELSSQLKATLQTHQEQIRYGQKDAATETLKKANELEKAIATLGTKEYRDTEEKFRQQKLALLKDIRDTVREYNQSAKYTLILDLSAVSPTGLPQVIDASGCTDITAEILKRLQQKKWSGQ